MENNLNYNGYIKIGGVIMQIFQEHQQNKMSAYITVRNKSQSSFMWHKNCEIAFPLDAPCSFWVAGEIIHAKKGDVVFFNSHT